MTMTMTMIDHGSKSRYDVCDHCDASKHQQLID